MNKYVILVVYTAIFIFLVSHANQRFVDTEKVAVTHRLLVDLSDKILNDFLRGTFEVNSYQDAWGRNIIIDVERVGKFGASAQARSSGPDGKFWTTDDISVVSVYLNIKDVQPEPPDPNRLLALK